MTKPVCKISDIILTEDIPPPTTQLACNAESLLPCFERCYNQFFGFCFTAQGLIQAQVGFIFFFRNELKWMQTRLNEKGTT